MNSYNMNMSIVLLMQNSSCTINFDILSLKNDVQAGSFLLCRWCGVWGQKEFTEPAKCTADESSKVIKCFKKEIIQYFDIIKVIFFDV